MRIISGTARGRKLEASKNLSTRPTEDRIKENVFNLIHGPYDGTRVLDLFSGTGSIGIEFLSRGSDYAWFNDISSQCRETIIHNLEHSDFIDRAKVFSKDYKDLLCHAQRESISFDYIYLDPPYEKWDYYNESMQLIEKYHLLKNRGCLILEAPYNYSFDFPTSMVVRKSKKYRDTTIWILDKCEEKR